MNWNNPSFVRKVIYLVCIFLLLLPIAALSQPATAGKGQERSAGGKLAQLRVQYRLSQAELGDIDPASETMKLATLGLRGIAVDILWYKAIDYQKRKDFTGMELTVKQIIRLQPNFMKVWDFQAHNLTYNSSVEFDNYRDRYAWVKKGIDFLITGTHYNRDEPGMYYSLGWYVGHKIGRADESKQFRRLFRADEDLHQRFRDQGVNVDDGIARHDGKPDNWLVGKLWFDKAEDAADNKKKSIRTKSPLVFYNGGPMAAINAAAAMEKDDGVFGQNARAAWQVGNEGWERFGNRRLPTYLGIYIQLNNLEALKKNYTDLEKKLDDLAPPGTREEVRQANIQNLPKREKELWDKDPELMTTEERAIRESMLTERVKASNDDIASHVSREKLADARAIADQIGRLGQELDMTARYRSTVNFDYWRARCNAEQTDEALKARELVHDAEALFETKKSLNDARKKYEEAWENWDAVFRKHPALFDSGEAQDLVTIIDHYATLLGQIDVKFPADFKLKSLLEMTPQGQALRKRLETFQAAAPEKTPGKAPEKKPEPTDKPSSETKAEEKPAAPAPAEKEPAKKADEKPAAPPAEKK